MAFILKRPLGISKWSGCALKNSNKTKRLFSSTPLVGPVLRRMLLHLCPPSCRKAWACDVDYKWWRLITWKGRSPVVSVNRHLTTVDRSQKKRLYFWWPVQIWLAKWCKIHKVYIRSHSMLYLLFRNIFIHIQQLSSYSRNTFIRI